MDPLAESVTRSIKNLKEKNDFLLQQRDHYLDVRQRMLNLRGSKDDEESGTGLVLGDIIISSQKVYMNLGYEYFIEKDVMEVLEYADEKLGLIEEAIEQFEFKIKDGEKTLKDLQNWGDQDALSHDGEDELPSMEIREELDEDGNVINSSVTPTSAERLKESLKSSKKKEEPENGTLDQFEKNLKGKLTKQEKRPSDDDSQTKETSYNPVDMENAYTFADLVRQMDEQDEADDEGDIAEVEYDFESFDEKLNSTAQEEDEEEDEDENDDDDDEGYYSVFPNMASHNAFMDQIKRLREGKGKEKPIETSFSNTVGKSTGAPKKSILKKKTDAKSERPKKSVGFASTLDIHEVENLKHENQVSTHMFPRSFMQPLEHGDEGENVEFDSDLFAQLIGAQGPDEIHDKYKDEVAKQQKPEEAEAEANGRKKRVSRFKKERKARDDESAQDVRSPNELATNSVITENVIEREESFDNSASDSGIAMTDTITENSFDDIIEAPLNEDVAEREVPMSEVKDREHSTTNEVAKELPGLIVERELDELPDSTEAPSARLAPLSKEMNSLRRPNISQGAKPSKLQELLDSSEDESDDNKPKAKEQISDSFPKEIIDKAEKESVLQRPKVDYNALGEDLDNMARAYALGVYDDDLDDDPGMVLEKVTDFKVYNEQVEKLKNEIEAFKISNPLEQQTEHKTDSDEDGPLMTDITENDIPENYCKTSPQDDLALDSERLHESIAIEYSRLREVIASRAKPPSRSPDDDEHKQIEPIDEDGQPIKQSRFRSQRFKLTK